MFTLHFWIIFAVGILASLCVSIVYGRRAIHPRLRPHFGLVVVVFLILVLVSFFIAVVLGKLVGGGVEEQVRRRANDAKAPPVEQVGEKPESGAQ